MTILNLQGSIFILMLLGLLLKKLNIITDQGKKCLNDLVVYAVLPCSTVKAFQLKGGDGMLSGFAAVLAIAAVVQVISVAAGRFLFLRSEEGHRQVMRYASICSNASFMGYPIAEGIYGDTGLLYASAFLIPQRIVMWTAGLACFTKGYSKKDAVKKVLTHPCIIAVEVGLIIMLFKIQLPEMISSVISTLGSCTTSLSMLIVGTVLADVDFRKIITKESLFFCAVRLLVLPAAAFGVCKAFALDPVVCGTAVLLTAMPAGSTTVILAGKYDGDSDFAAKTVVLSTVLSLVTIPMWTFLLQ